MKYSDLNKNVFLTIRNQYLITLIIYRHENFPVYSPFIENFNECKYFLITIFSRREKSIQFRKFDYVIFIKIILKKIGTN